MAPHKEGHHDEINTWPHSGLRGHSEGRKGKTLKKHSGLKGHSEDRKGREERNHVRTRAPWWDKTIQASIQGNREEGNGRQEKLLCIEEIQLLWLHAFGFKWESPIILYQLIFSSTWAKLQKKVFPPPRASLPSFDSIQAASDRK